MNPFAGLKDAKTFEDGNYLDEGNYKARIVKTIYHKAQKGHYALITELVLLESDNPKFKVGEKVSWYQKENESFLPEVKLFCIAACGFDSNNQADAARIKTEVEPQIEEIMNQAITNNKLAGREVFVKVTSKDQKKDPTKKFNKHKFSPAQPPAF